MQLPNPKLFTLVALCCTAATSKVFVQADSEIPQTGGANSTNPMHSTITSDDNSTSTIVVTLMPSDTILLPVTNGTDPMHSSSASGSDVVIVNQPIASTISPKTSTGSRSQTMAPVLVMTAVAACMTVALM
ncbi:hypothetical protein FI667_g8396, partial [Globisporangium splendens]